MNLYKKCERKILLKSVESESELELELESRSKYNNNKIKTRTEILKIFFFQIQRFALFAQNFQPFNHINYHDQEILLRAGVLELCFIRGAFLFNKQTKSWSDDLLPENHSHLLHENDLKIMVTDMLLEKHLYFIDHFQKLGLDEPTIMLLSVIVLLTADRTGLANSELIQIEQEKYLILLKNYMNWRFGVKRSSILYPKLLLKVTDLRELAEAHTDYQLILCKDELKEIQPKIQCLHINNHHDDKPKSLTNHKINDFIWTINNYYYSKIKNINNTNSNSRHKIEDTEEEISTSSDGSDKLSSE